MSGGGEGQVEVRRKKKKRAKEAGETGGEEGRKGGREEEGARVRKKKQKKQTHSRPAPPRKPCPGRLIQCGTCLKANTGQDGGTHMATQTQVKAQA